MPREAQSLTVSADGYVRLTRTRLRQLSLVHLLSGLDVEVESYARGAGACATSISGFTEWVTQTDPALSIGWYWRLAALQRTYQRLDHPFSNIMLIDGHRRDFGHQTTAILLGGEIDSLPWQAVVERHIREGYTWPLSA
jgi:hypothetical protein